MPAITRAATAAFVIVMPAMAAAITIDTYETSTPILAPAIAGPASNTITDPAGALPGDRTLTVNNTDISSGIVMANIGQMQTRVWQIDAASFSSADVDLDYHLSAPVDFSGFASVDFTLLEYDNENESKLTMTLESGMGSAGSTLTFDNAQVGQALSFALADYAGVDLTAVDKIAFAFDGGLAVDAVLSPFTTTVVPLPTALPMLVGGLAALGVAARRRRQ